MDPVGEVDVEELDVPVPLLVVVEVALRDEVEELRFLYHC